MFNEWKLFYVESIIETTCSSEYSLNYNTLDVELFKSSNQRIDILVKGRSIISGLRNIPGWKAIKKRFEWRL